MSSAVPPPDNSIVDEKNALYCGVDVGASATKVVLIDDNKEIKSSWIQPSGVEYSATVEHALSAALDQIGASHKQIKLLTSTGYGRHNVSIADATLTEIQCHGAGCYFHFPQAITIIDIGGQDNKVIRLEESGLRIDFKMNRKCAAGTGAFIEEIALRLNIDISEMNQMAERAENPVRLNSFCTVFAKTEILSYLRRGIQVEGIIRGAFDAVIERVIEMAPLEGHVVLTGGVVAHNPIIARILAEKLKKEVLVPPKPQLTGAFGAALASIKKLT